MAQEAKIIKEFQKHLSRGDICHTRGPLFVVLSRLQSSEKVFTKQVCRVSPLLHMQTHTWATCPSFKDPALQTVLCTTEKCPLHYSSLQEEFPEGQSVFFPGGSWNTEAQTGNRVRVQDWRQQTLAEGGIKNVPFKLPIHDTNKIQQIFFALSKYFFF